MKLPDPTPIPEEERQYRRTINAWAMYDWANSAFATTIIAAVLPVYFGTLARNAGVDKDAANAYWGYTNSVSMLLIALLGPMLGTLSDLTGGKKKFVAAFAGLGAVSCLLMALGNSGGYQSLLVLYVVGSLGFAGGNIFYESLLPHVAKPGDLDRVSARGYAFGYVGGGLLLVVNALWLAHPGWFGMPDKAFAAKACFVSVGFWWAGFTLPLLRRVPEPPAPAQVPNTLRAVKQSFVQLGRTLRELRRYRQLALFLVAFWIYNDGISTIIKMATKYGESLDIGQQHMIGALVITQFVGFPAALFFGRLAGRIGAKRAILLGVAVYAVISVLGFFMRSAVHFYVLAVLVGLVQGGTQALSRSLFASMVPRHQAAEFFGFYSTGAKFAGILGPLVFGALAQAVGSRWGILAIILFFVVGGLLLLRVDEREGARVAREEEEQAGG